MNEQELKDKIELAKIATGVAHLYPFELVLRPGAKEPVCELCGGMNAPIVNNQHLSGFCNQEGDTTK